MMTLTELQQDAIGELLNIGMGRAARALSEMVSEEVSLSIPEIELKSEADLEEYLDAAHHGSMTAVNQHFQGPFWGDACLLFPEKRSLELVRLLVGEDLPLEALTDMEQEALQEIGNVIINACLGSLSNILGGEVKTNLPEFYRGTYKNIVSSLGSERPEEQIILVIRIEFGVLAKDINGYFAILFDVGALQAFLKKVDEFIGVAS
ncbi:MAG: chemotaxis protein CheC [Gammaproteobacteria bacterium]|nr:chemotaxis protein CheC [Gammaproteobacteria bacterium]